MKETREQQAAVAGSNGAPPSRPATATLVEEGSAFMQLTHGAAGETRAPAARRREMSGQRERVEVVVIGAGQSGLSVGYHLSRLGIPFVILEAKARVGDPWRTRWDSLRLFTPAGFDGLDGMRFPQQRFAFPTKDEMADYLEAYAARFSLPVRTAVRVNRVVKQGDRYLVTAGNTTYEADHVVVAMSSYQDPWTPRFARELDPAIVQLHSFAYRNPAQLRTGDVLIVGAANSGAEIAVELVRAGHGVYVAGRHPGHVPFRVSHPVAAAMLVPFLFRVVFHRVLTVETPIGRKMRRKFVGGGGPLIRVKPKDLAAAGVQRTPRVAGAREGRPVLDDGRVLDVSSVIWCTGFRNDYSWIERPVFDDHGEPALTRSLARGESGLYFVGLHFQHSLSSTMIHGVGRDARFAAEQIAARRKAAR